MKSSKYTDDFIMNVLSRYPSHFDYATLGNNARIPELFLLGFRLAEEGKKLEPHEVNAMNWKQEISYKAGQYEYTHGVPYK